MLEKKTILDRCEVVGMDSLPSIQCRHKTFVQDTETGEIIGGVQYSRHVLNPHSDLAGEDAQVVALANVLFTAEAKAAYTAKLAEDSL